MNIQTLIKISRPKFWGYLAGTFLVGYTSGINNIQDFYTPTFFILLGFFLVPANIFLYGINDLFDQETDLYNSKKGISEHRLLKKETTQIITILITTLLVSLITLVILPSLTIKIIFICFLLLAAFYSTPPLRFKARPLIDSISNILYILPGIIGYLIVSNQPLNWAIITAISLWAIAMHLFSAIPDIEADKKANLTTTAVLFGKVFALCLCTLLWFAFSLISLQQLNLFPFSLLTLVYPLIPVLLIFQKRVSVIEVYWYFPTINHLLGFILFVLLLWQKI